MKTITRQFALLLFSTLLFTACKKDTAINNSNPNPPVANAGADQYLTGPAGSAILYGSGISENGPIISYSWVMISGPVTADITNPAADITDVNNLVDGLYEFELTVTDSLGLTAADTTLISISTPPVQTITNQPDNNPFELNFAVHDGGEASAHMQDLDAGAWTWGGTYMAIRGSFGFDLSAIPPTAIIVSAKLSLYSNPTPINGDLINANSGFDNSMHIRRISDAWNPSTATWDTQPATDATNQVIIPHTDQLFLDLVDIDVTAMVQEMVSGTNNGFMMGLETEDIYNIRQFASSVHPDATKHPKLVVSYQ